MNQRGPLALCIQGLALYAPWALATVQRQGWHQKREGRLGLWAKVFALRAQVEQEDAKGRDSPPWPGQPILASRLPGVVQKTSAGLQHGQGGRLL